MVTASEAIEAELAELRKREPALADGVLASSALEMARGLDSTASLAQKTLAAKELREIMDRLRELAPAEKAKDRVDDLRDRRAKRLAGGSKAARKQRS